MIILRGKRLRETSHHVAFRRVFQGKTKHVDTVLMLIGIPTSKRMQYGAVCSGTIHKGRHRADQTENLYPTNLRLRITNNAI